MLYRRNIHCSGNCSLRSHPANSKTQWGQKTLGTVRQYSNARAKSRARFDPFEKKSSECATLLGAQLDPLIRKSKEWTAKPVLKSNNYGVSKKVFWELSCSFSFTFPHSLSFTTSAGINTSTAVLVRVWPTVLLAKFPKKLPFEKSARFDPFIPSFGNRVCAT